MRSTSEILAPLTHAITLDEWFHIGDYMWPPHTISKSLEHLMSAKIAQRVTSMKLSKQQLLQPACLGYNHLLTMSTWVSV